MPEAWKVLLARKIRLSIAVTRPGLQSPSVTAGSDVKLQGTKLDFKNLPVTAARDRFFILFQGFFGGGSGFAAKKNVSVTSEINRKISSLQPVTHFM